MFSKMLISQVRNVSKSHKCMKAFFSLFPPAVLVIIDGPSNCNDFLSFLNCIYVPLKMVSKVTANAYLFLTTTKMPSNSKCMAKIRFPFSAKKLFLPNYNYLIQWNPVGCQSYSSCYLRPLNSSKERQAAVIGP